jgi:hypothetical protein
VNVKPPARAPLAIFPILAAIVSIAMLTPAGAGAATVVNGDFEAGDLSGWQVENLPESSGN